VRVPDRLFDGYVFDLDGTVYLGDELLPQARETLHELKQRSSVVYLTNKPLEMPADYAAMLAAIEASTGASAEAIVGKPSPHMAATLLNPLGVPAQDTLLVGDRLATDIRMANEAGMASALVLTGATGLDEALRSEDRPDYVIGHLGDLLPRGDESPAAARPPDRGNE
jgi:ribonucleotide monophosphatase NagD (HAD superfamily)